MEHIRFFIITVGEPIFCLFSNKGKHYLIVENREWRYIHNKVLYKIITAAYLIYARRRGGGGGWRLCLKWQDIMRFITSGFLSIKIHKKLQDIICTAIIKVANFEIDFQVI